MLAKLADAGVRRPRRIAVIAVLAVIVAGVVGGPAPGVLKARNDFEDPGSQAASARQQLERATRAEPEAGVLALVEAPPASAAAAAAARTLRADRDVAGVVTYAQTHDPALASRDGRSTIIAASLRSGVDSDSAVTRISDSLAGQGHVLLGGADVAQQQVSQQASADLGFAELLVFPLLALLALIIFRGIAALLPLLVGGASVLAAFTVLRGINAAVPLSIFCLNLVIGAGLGLAVDYSLFLVSRFREEIGAGAEVPQAIRTTMATAGRTVVFSALTVAAAMASLTVFPLRFLQSMGIGGAVVALVAAAVALSILPALFMLLGRRIGRHVPGPEREGRWYRLAHAVMRHPGPVAALTAIALIVVATPSLGAKWSGVDASVLPTSKSARVVNDRIVADFPRVDQSPIVLAISAPPTAGGQVQAYALTLRRVGGITAVSAPRYLGAHTWQLNASAPGAAIQPAAQHAVPAVRALPAPFPVAVGGDAAQFHDRQAAIGAKLPLALAILVVTTLLVLWVMTASVVLPVKALVMNALTVGVATGLLVFVFQRGRLGEVLAYRSQGGIESTDFLVLVAIVFALSTDYGVFLLTRIKEAHDSGIGNREAVAVGLQRTGAIVTAAAVLLAVAIGAFSTSHLVFLKELGVGTAVAVLVDAFLVRTLLVPALMGLLGSWNWWQPAPLRRVHDRLRVGEAEAVLA